MPHNFIRISAETPNPGRRKRGDVEATCRQKGGHLHYLWFDDADHPTAAYVLVEAEDKDVDGIVQALHGEQVIRLVEAT
jgi:hypothetical protein